MNVVMVFLYCILGEKIGKVSVTDHHYPLSHKSIGDLLGLESKYETLV